MGDLQCGHLGFFLILTTLLMHSVCHKRLQHGSLIKAASRIGPSAWQIKQVSHVEGESSQSSGTVASTDIGADFSFSSRAASAASLLAFSLAIFLTFLSWAFFCFLWAASNAYTPPLLPVKFLSSSSRILSAIKNCADCFIFELVLWKLHQWRVV